MIMFFAGVVSGLLGVGSGVLKVLAMDWAMNLPMKVSTTTSNYMIGITAATSGSLYWLFGYISPFTAACTAIGVLIGSMIGTRILIHVTNRQIRWIFIAVLAYFGSRMLLRGLGLEGLLPITPQERTALSIVSTAVVVLSLYLIWGRRGENANHAAQLQATQPDAPEKIEMLFTNLTSNLLRYGVLLSTALVLLGLLLMAARGGGMGMPLGEIANPQSHVDTSKIAITAILADAARLDGLGVALLGLITLMAVPVALVALNLVKFALERDALYAAMAAVTLANLAASALLLPLLIH